MYRTHHCGGLRLANAGEQVTLSGWVQRSREFGGMIFIDLRDRYGITQLVFNMETAPDLCEQAKGLGREYVIKVTGNVAERSNKNPNLSTGDIELIVEELDVLTRSEVPPFTIEDETDGGEELRYKYRYLDLRRPVNQRNMQLRHQMAFETRRHMTENQFLEIETPYLIKSTPEGARDFIVPSRMNEGQFYALPQSPQTFKQLLMVGGYDRYFQIVKCFRDEDFRADRQPEFTQIDCEMAFVNQADVLNMFEGLARHLFKEVKGVELDRAFPRISYDEALSKYGSDKPDVRFDMTIRNISTDVKGKGFNVFELAEYVGGIVAKGCANYSRKQLDALTDYVKRPQIGAKGLVYVKLNEDGTVKSSVDKFFSPDDLLHWANKMDAGKGDLLLILSGKRFETLQALGELRLEMGRRLDLMNKNVFAPLWVVDFPLFEYDPEEGRYFAMHHPFTAPKEEDVSLFESDPAAMRANAYDFVINGMEIGGGSIRIHDPEIQSRMFSVLGFSQDEAQKQFGFLMNAFKYGAPPHGGIAFGFDRWVALFAGMDSIRDVIAFPKNNAGRDVMINSPDFVSVKQLEELNIQIKPKA